MFNYLYLSIILSAILAIVVVLEDEFNLYSKLEQAGAFVVVFVVSMMLFIGIGFVVIDVAKGFASCSEQVSSSCRIFSLNDSKEYTGSFVLGTGSIDQVEYYASYVQVANNGYKKQKYKVDTSVIFEDAEVPHVDFKQRVYSSKFIDFMGWDGPIVESAGYEIHVPKNTIIKEFKLN